jgi:hypothetical protein
MFDWRSERRRLSDAVSRLDRQTVTVLCSAALLVILQMQIGDRDVFREHFGPAFGQPWRGLLEWGWWFGMQGVLGFVVPVFLLRRVFRLTADQAGLGRGDWGFALRVAALYLPLVVVGTWFLSDGDAFLARYPHLKSAKTDWSVFLAYEAFFLAYWFGWEYLWRGFVLFGTRHTLGLYAIFVQAVPFAILHFNKPMAEALLSLVGGVALGALVWRTRSFWIAVPIHAAQMMILDLWCSLRTRTGARGVGLDALLELLRGL